MDYSFLKLYNTIDNALNDTEFKDAGLSYFLSIQLSPKETYLQITNSSTDLTFSSNFSAYVVDGCDNVLKDISSHVFMEDFIDAKGVTQSKIEIVNIGQDFFGRAVFVKLVALDSNVVYYTRPIKITDKDIEKSYRFDYTNNLNMYDMSYEIALATQSIRLVFKFTGYKNDSEVGEYYQISSKNTISTRFLKKISNNYSVERIDTYTFDRLQWLFEHDTIYIDNNRLTTNPVLDPGDRIGQSNLFGASFNGFINKDDQFIFVYQIFGGLLLTDLSPVSTLNICDTGGTLDATFNIDIEIGIGSLKLYDASDNSLVNTWDETELYLSSGNVLTAAGLTTYTTAGDSYYITFSSGLVLGLGISYTGFLDNTTWSFSVSAGEYDESEYDNDEYVVGCTPLDRVHNDIFNSNYN